MSTDQPTEPEAEVAPPDGPDAAPLGDADDVAEPVAPLSVEDLVAELEAVIHQRDEYLRLAQAKQAEFENYRKRMTKQQAEDASRAAAKLVEGLLPVLDAFDYGVAHGDDSLAPMRAQLLGALEREGLERLLPDDAPFDPNEHDAVAHEPGEGDVPTVAETLRAGYRWHGNLLRPAMVRVRD